jgi:hypothetical protein
MIIESSANTSTNMQNVTQFKLSTNSQKLFASLSNFLYSNKELCVMHEISANAYDAHLSIGKGDIPFKVTLPTSLHKELTIRDFGPGLSESAVYGLLTSYGESTKQNSDDFIGGFGIGAKSPAAISKTWTITTYHAGNSIKFLVFVGDDGIPSIAKLNECVSDLPCGVEVSIPVENISTYFWSNLASSVYEYYPVKPILINASSQTKPNKSLVFSHGAFDLYRCHPIVGGISVIASNRKYSITTDMISKICAANAFAYDVKIFDIFIECGLEIKTNIGDVELSLSREALQLTKKTSSFIFKKLVEFISLVKQSITSELSGVTSIHKAKIIVSGNNFVKKLGATRLNSVFFRYLGLNEYKIINYDDLTFIKLPACNDSYLVSRGHSDRVVAQKIAPGKYYGNIRANSDSSVVVGLNNFNKLKLVLNDCKQFRSKLEHNYVSGEIYLCVSDVSIYNDYFDSHIVASELPSPPKQTREKRSIVGYHVLRSNFSSCEKMNIELDDSTYYMVFSDLRSTVLSSAEIRALSLIKYTNIICVKEGKTPPKNIKSVTEVLVDIKSKFVYNDYIGVLTEDANLKQLNIGNRVLNQLISGYSTKIYNSKFQMYMWKLFPNIKKLGDGFYDKLTEANSLIIINDFLKEGTITKLVTHDLGGMIDDLHAEFPILDIIGCKYSKSELELQILIDCLNNYGVKK